MQHSPAHVRILQRFLPVVAVALMGCNGNQHLLGRYRSATCVDEIAGVRTPCPARAPGLSVAVSLAPKAPDKTAETSLATLPDTVAAHYVDALARLDKTAEALRRDLAQPIAGPTEAVPFADRTLFAGTLYLSAAYVAPFNPADRIDRLHVTITFENGSIVSWTGARTTFSDIKPGTITSTGKASLSGSLDIKPPSSPAGGSLMASTDRTREEHLEVTQHIEDITVIVQPENKAIAIVRRGGLGLDLTGNAQVDVVLASDNVAATTPTLYSFSGYAKPDGSPNDPAKLRLLPTQTRLPTADLQGLVTGYYVIRHVVSGDGTSEEGDDTVEFITRAIVPAKVTIPVSPTQRWGLTSSDDPKSFLAIKPSPESYISKLCFATEAQADALRDYLGSLPRPPAGISGKPVGIENRARLDPLRTRDLTTTAGCR